MPRTPSNPSNFTSDNHTLYAGWVIGQAKKHLGDMVHVMTDEAGNFTPNLEVVFAPGVSVRLVIPPPPDGWDPFNVPGLTIVPDVAPDDLPKPAAK